jgi:hypothetical protein
MTENKNLELSDKIALSYWTLINAGSGAKC